MKAYRMELHGRVLECREGDLGGESVYVDGRVVSRKPLAGWLTGMGGTVLHSFDIRDEQGAARRVEVRWEPKARTLGFTQRVRVQVDGRDRAVLEAVKSGALPGCCANCGYALRGLPVDCGEVKCPECGRHTSAAMVELS